MSFVAPIIRIIGYGTSGKYLICANLYGHLQVTEELESHLGSMKNLAIGLVSHQKKLKCGGLGMDANNLDLEKHVCELLGISSITAPVTSFAFTRHDNTGVSSVQFPPLQHSYVV